jgi:selenide,water dikinase
VHPDEVFTNAGAQPGDTLVLTKPIGLGVISTALTRDAADGDVIARAIDVMTTLNASAAAAARAVGVHAATDVTGFGLLGHLRELCAASNVAAVLDAHAVPVIPGVRDLLGRDMVAGGTRRNHAFVAPDVDFGVLTETEQLLLADAQTSGGLLLSVPPSHTAALVDALVAHGTLAASPIGHVRANDPGAPTISIAGAG